MIKDRVEMERRQMRDKFNYGLAILRGLMCFEVILSHLWVDSYSVHEVFYLFRKLRPIAVPVFMIISFYFMGSHFINYSKKDFKKRIWRIYYPLLGWGVYFLFYIVYDFAFGENHVELLDLFFQITMGHSFNQTMWYQFALLVITVIFYAGFRIFSEKHFIPLLVLLSLIVLLSQYLGLGHFWFDRNR